MEQEFAFELISDRCKTTYDVNAICCAAAVAAGLVGFTIATETTGSIMGPCLLRRNGTAAYLRSSQSIRLHAIVLVAR